MFRNLPLVLAAIVIVLAIGGVARILFRPRRPRAGGFVESLGRLDQRESRIDRPGVPIPVVRVSANPVREFRRDGIDTNFGMF